MCRMDIAKVFFFQRIKGINYYKMVTHITIFGLIHSVAQSSAAMISALVMQVLG